MNTPSFHVGIAVNLNDFLQLISQFEAFCLQCDIPKECVNRALIILDELFSNCLKYGYRDESATGHFTVKAKLQKTCMKLTVSNDGIAFNPIRHAVNPETDARLEDRPIGGLGLLLISQLSDAIHYRRVGNKNILNIQLMPRHSSS